MTIRKKHIFALTGGLVTTGLVGWYVFGADAEDTALRDDASPVTNTDSLYTKSNSDRSFEEELIKRQEDNAPLAVAVTGSSVAAGEGASDYSKTWVALLEEQLNGSDERLSVDVTNFGVSGFKISDLLSEGVIEDLIQSEPDVVLIETSVINSYFHNEPLEETKQSIETTANQLEENLPEAYVLFIAPNPISESVFSVATNDVGFDEYVFQTEEYIVEAGWDYFDSYTSWNDEIKDTEIDLDQLLGDGVHPNDEGYQMWFDLINESVIQS